MAEPARKNSTLQGKRVLDMFLGSGTKNDRIRADQAPVIDPRYCDVIVKRYLVYVGRDDAPTTLLKRFCMPPMPT